jgi:hypothetical protein
LQCDRESAYLAVTGDNRAVIPEASLKPADGGLVLSGECLLLIEGQERRLKAWDFVHCPAWTEHVFVGAGEGPCAILAIGTRLSDDVIYPVSELAQRHGAGVQHETRDPEEAYADVADDDAAGYRDGWLPG